MPYGIRDRLSDTVDEARAVDDEVMSGTPPLLKGIGGPARSGASLLSRGASAVTGGSKAASAGSKAASAGSKAASGGSKAASGGSRGLDMARRLAGAGTLGQSPTSEASDISDTVRSARDWEAPEIDAEIPEWGQDEPQGPQLPIGLIAAGGAVLAGLLWRRNNAA